MTRKLRRALTTSLVVIAVWTTLLIVTAILMQMCWAIWQFASPHHYDRLMRSGLNIWLWLMASGLPPAVALRITRARWIGAYMAAGAGSTLLAMYTFVTMTDLGPPQAFCCVHNPNLPDLLVLLFSDGRNAFREFLETNGPDTTIGISAAPGLILGFFEGLILRPKPIAGARS